MKAHPLTLLLLLAIFSASAQRYSGFVTDKESGQPIPFVNIGITGKDIGTVSDILGWFAIEIPGENSEDTLCVSCIGYEQKTFCIRDLKSLADRADGLEFALTPKSYLLKEVVVRPVATRTYTLGNPCEADSPYGNAFYSDKLGTEMGVMIPLPRKYNRAQLKKFSCYVGEFTYDSFPVRLNVYNVKNGLPFENILAEPIFVEIIEEGEFIVDLARYNIVVHGDFFISLEYFRTADQADGKLVFCAVHRRKMRDRNGFYRLTSQGNWNREMFDNVGFSVEVECEK